ncbi:hypothetical protein SSAG_03214 [Streptomyces sp. Mg1]|nr:hypothetical protein SSAG_03214 [Streptomyces sp. Mg1]
MYFTYNIYFLLLPLNYNLLLPLCFFSVLYFFSLIYSILG